MKLRRLIISISLILVSLFAFGCADVEVIRAVDGNGVIMDRLVVTLEKEKLGSYYPQVKNGVITDMENFVTHVNTWVEQFQDKYTEVYMALKLGLSITPPVIDNNADQFTLTIQFSNWQIFAIFYGLAEIEGVEYQRAVEDIGPFVENILRGQYSTENMGLFLYKYSLIKDDGIMAGLETFEANGTNYLEKYTEMTGGHFDMEDVNLTQIFAYPDERLKSNADTVEVTGGMTFLAWNLNSRSEPMSIYKVAPRAISWYVLALILTIIITVILYFVIKQKHKGDSDINITKQEIESK